MITILDVRISHKYLSEICLGCKQKTKNSLPNVIIHYLLVKKHDQIKEKLVQEKQYVIMMKAA